MQKRKRGRPKGATGSYFVEVKMADLIGLLGNNFTATVSRKWLESIGLEVDTDKPNRVKAAVEEPPETTIEYTIE